MTLTEAIQASKAADDAFEAAIQAAGYRTRWAWHKRKDPNPVLEAAYAAKLAADAAMHDAFEATRLHAAGRTKASNDIGGL